MSKIPTQCFYMRQVGKVAIATIRCVHLERYWGSINICTHVFYRVANSRARERYKPNRHLQNYTRGVRSGTNTMSMKAAIMLLMAMALLLRSTEAAQYTVGESIGWGLGNDLEKWATQYTFHVGDDLCKLSSPLYALSLSLSVCGSSRKRIRDRVKC